MSAFAGSFGSRLQIVLSVFNKNSTLKEMVLEDFQTYLSSRSYQFTVTLETALGHFLHFWAVSMVILSAQGWTNRTLISHEPLICSKTCFTKTESVQ